MKTRLIPLMKTDPAGLYIPSQQSTLAVQEATMAKHSNDSRTKEVFPPCPLLTLHILPSNRAHHTQSRIKARGEKMITSFSPMEARIGRHRHTYVHSTQEAKNFHTVLLKQVTSKESKEVRTRLTGEQTVVGFKAFHS